MSKLLSPKISTFSSFDPGAVILQSWRTNARVSAYLVERLPMEIWNTALPGMPRRSVRSIAAHLHNARARWIRTLGSEHGVSAPALTDSHRVAQRELLAALRRSSKGIENLLTLGLSNGGEVPPSKGYVWRNLPLDVGHVLTYFVAHEAHHRGQLVMAARQLGHRLPIETTGGLWQWRTRSQET